MKNKTLILCTLFLCISAVVVANHKSDSLRYEISNETDREKIAQLQLDYYWELKYENLKEALEGTRMATEVLKKRGNADYAKGLSYIGVYQYMQDSIPQAIAFLERAEALLLNQDNPELLARVYNNFGVFYSALYDRETALNYYQKSLKIKETQIPNADLSSSLINISTILYDQGKFEECLETNERALIYGLENNDLETCAIIYSNLGVAHERLGNFSQGLGFTLKALEIYQNEIHNDAALARTYSNLGANYLGQEKLNEAEFYFNLALEINIKINNRSNIIVCTNNLAETARQAGKFKEAEKLALTALNEANEIENLEEKKISLEILSMIAEGQRDFEKSLQLHKSYVELSDSLTNSVHSVSVEKAILQNEISMQKIQDQKAMALQNVVNKKIMVMISFVSLFIVTLILWIVGVQKILTMDKKMIHSLNYLIPFLLSGSIVMFIMLKTSVPEIFGVFVNVLILILIIALGLVVHLFLQKKSETILG
jgi:tetratricopeptide (TPR) repeat protein